MASIPTEPNSVSDNRNARLPGNIVSGRTFTENVNERAVVDTRMPNVQEQVIQSATPTRHSRMQVAFGLASAWWQDPLPFLGRAAFRAFVAIPAGRTTEPVRRRNNIARPPSGTTAEVIYGPPLLSDVPGLETEGEWY